jgi:hypothetical protein
MQWIKAASIVGVWASLAYGQAPDPQSPPALPEYPVEVVDRPLVMHAGMSEIGVGYSRGEDESSSRIFYSHSFGRVELAAQLDTDDSSYIGVRVAPTRSLVIGFRFYGAGGTYAEGGNYYRLGQSLSATYRVLHVPHRFQLNVGGGVFVEELHDDPDMGPFREGVSTTTDIGVGGYVQLARNLSAFANVSAAALVHSTAGNERDGRFSVSGGLQFALRSWDFIAGGGAGDVTDARRPFIFALISFRWGM